MALVSYRMKSPCWSAGTRPNGCRCKCTGRYISSSVSWKRYATLRAVRMRPATFTKVLRGKPNRVTSAICHLLSWRGSSGPGVDSLDLHAVGLDRRDDGRAFQERNERPDRLGGARTHRHTGDEHGVVLQSVRQRPDEGGGRLADDLAHLRHSERAPPLPG